MTQQTTTPSLAPLSFEVGAECFRGRPQQTHLAVALPFGHITLVVLSLPPSSQPV